jgi:hypothetical protein
MLECSTSKDIPKVRDRPGIRMASLFTTMGVHRLWVSEGEKLSSFFKGRLLHTE